MNPLNKRTKSRNRMCSENGCNKQASYGYYLGNSVSVINLPKGVHENCSKHKKEGMVNLCAYKCLECKKTALFGYDGNKPRYCSDHKKEDTINLKNHKCLNCDSRASFGYESNRKRLYCAYHSKTNMVNLDENKRKIIKNYKTSLHNKSIFFDDT